MSTETTNPTAAAATEHEPGEAFTPDLDVIVPEAGGGLTIGGIPASVKRLRMRELIALGRVMTAGASPALGAVKLNTNDPEAMGADLAAILMLALPNAIEEFCDFLAALVEARDPSDASRLASYVRDNPDLEELVDVLNVMVEQEKDTLASLAGKLQGTIALLSKTA